MVAQREEEAMAQNHMVYIQGQGTSPDSTDARPDKQQTVRRERKVDRNTIEEKRGEDKGEEQRAESR